MSNKKAVLITGGARRVGAAITRYFAQHGYDIALHYHHSKADARKLKKEVEALGNACELFPHDLQDIKAIPKFMRQVKQALPGCNTLINNASVFERAEFMETDEALFDHQFTVNLKAPFFLTQEFARVFGKGCVINLLDTEIEHNHGSHFAYLLSKKAFMGFTQMAARDLGPAIRVNGVCPGIMMPSNELDKSYMEKLAKTLPLGKLADPEQVAYAAHWLCMNEIVTGQCLYIDGGQHLL